MRIAPPRLVLAASAFFFLGIFSLPPEGYFTLPVILSSPPPPRYFFTPSPRPLVKASFEESLSARSWLVMDVKSGTVLAGKNINVSFPPASLTKIATAIVALNHYSLDEVLTVDKEYPVGRTMGLQKGERIKVIDLLAGLLIHSANDAAYVLAAHFPGGEKAFVGEMNSLVQRMGLKRTVFENFDGEEAIRHYTTAFEIARLARRLLRFPIARELVILPQKTVWSVDGKISHQLETTNQLLPVLGENRGLKTGWTNQAKECFVGYFEIFSSPFSPGREILTVVLGSDDRFGETVKLLRWVKNNVVWRDYSENHSLEIAGTKATKL
ncbi:D-alanyl-D-alanine carboxypeptidase [bacterium]|nr:D-alanyl-D-alanine carboxypeptidase [bacterium]